MNTHVFGKRLGEKVCRFAGGSHTRASVSSLALDLFDCREARVARSFGQASVSSSSEERSDPRWAVHPRSEANMSFFHGAGSGLGPADAPFPRSSRGDIGRIGPIRRILRRRIRLGKDVSAVRVRGQIKLSCASTFTEARVCEPPAKRPLFSPQNTPKSLPFASRGQVALSSFNSPSDLL